MSTIYYDSLNKLINLADARVAEMPASSNLSEITDAAIALRQASSALLVDLFTTADGTTFFGETVQQQVALLAKFVFGPTSNTNTTLPIGFWGPEHTIEAATYPQPQRLQILAFLFGGLRVIQEGSFLSTFNALTSGLSNAQKLSFLCSRDWATGAAPSTMSPGAMSMYVLHLEELKTLYESLVSSSVTDFPARLLAYTATNGANGSPSEFGSYLAGNSDVFHADLISANSSACKAFFHHLLSARTLASFGCAMMPAFRSNPTALARLYSRCTTVTVPSTITADMLLYSGRCIIVSVKSTAATTPTLNVVGLLGQSDGLMTRLATGSVAAPPNEDAFGVSAFGTTNSGENLIMGAYVSPTVTIAPTAGVIVTILPVD